MDPTNGFIAIHAEVLHHAAAGEAWRRAISFESDLLFRLARCARWSVMPVRAHYADEQSSLLIGATALGFPLKYASRLGKRLFYNHFLRDFNLGSVSLVIGLLLLGSGGMFGALEWYRSYATGHPATAGTVMLVALQLIVSLNLLIRSPSTSAMCRAGCCTAGAAPVGQAQSVRAARVARRSAVPTWRPRR
jgi:hypothetical protein